MHLNRSTALSRFVSAQEKFPARCGSMATLLAQDAVVFPFVLAITTHMGRGKCLAAFRASFFVGAGSTSAGVTFPAAGADIVFVGDRSVHVPFECLRGIDQIIETFKRNCEIVGVSKHTRLGKETRLQKKQIRFA